jgi:hypothetical protein
MAFKRLQRINYATYHAVTGGTISLILRNLNSYVSPFLLTVGKMTRVILATKLPCYNVRTLIMRGSYLAVLKIVTRVPKPIETF